MIQKRLNDIRRFDQIKAKIDESSETSSKK